MGKDTEKSPEQIEIHFGMVFEKRLPSGELYKSVILHVKTDGNSFCDCDMIENNDKVLLAPAGTSNISDIVGPTEETWTQEQIWEASKHLFKNSEWPEMQEILNRYSQDPPRILTK